MLKLWIIKIGAYLLTKIISIKDILDKLLKENIILKIKALFTPNSENMLVNFKKEGLMAKVNTTNLKVKLIKFFNLQLQHIVYKHLHNLI